MTSSQVAITPQMHLEEILLMNASELNYNLSHFSACCKQNTVYCFAFCLWFVTSLVRKGKNKPVVQFVDTLRLAICSILHMQ
jgi:hypothetical protein